eukprot:4196638-Karenia_brevis.AAC.1
MFRFDCGCEEGELSKVLEWGEVNENPGRPKTSSFDRSDPAACPVVPAWPLAVSVKEEKYEQNERSHNAKCSPDRSDPAAQPLPQLGKQAKKKK